MEVYQPIYQVNQWIVLSELVISKDQRVETIKQSNIEVQSYIITSMEYYEQVRNFRDSIVE